MTEKRLSLDELKAEYQKAATEGKKHAAEVQREHNYDRNALATIRMNACIQMKRYIAREYGKQVLET